MMLLNFVLVASLLVGALGQRDYLDEPLRAPPPRRPAPARIDPDYSGPAAPRPTPVPILKQINRHNEDGSYTYGYESADGSFKIETKLPTGEVKGKYGFIDDVGKVRVVEYGATKYGFEPSGEGITVAPPTLVDDTTHKDGTLKAEYADDLYEPAAPAPKSKYQNYPQNFPSRNVAPQSFQPAPPRPKPQQYAPLPPPPPAPQRNFGPAPPRPNIPGASLALDFGGPARASPAPARPQAPRQSFQPEAVPIEEDNYEQDLPVPPRPKVTYARPAPPPPRPQQPSFQPDSDFGPPPQRPAHRPAAVTRQIGSGPGILDQLAKDYALPANGGAPLHDISFGYY
ncbi:formin-like protein 14 [Agrilus planipennis]|uniref:Formin-like protein 14 n=1 Tax=Agrilus planipennis TaxID=224129 RepID=A0A1W4W7R1_AGRPL|nr:formin-like protein 14 [Agrilus planipennis]XP_025829326.1 formin-like protein 14 [Agrilus planipennis]